MSQPRCGNCHWVEISVEGIAECVWGRDNLPAPLQSLIPQVIIVKVNDDGTRCSQWRERFTGQP